MVFAAIFGGLVTTVTPLIKDEISLLWNFKEDVETLLSTLSTIDAVLADAERKTLWEKNKQTKEWLRKLNHVAYEVRDIIDKWSLEDLQVKRLQASSTGIQVTNYIARPFRITWTHHKIGNKIKDIQKKLNKISSDRNNLQLVEYYPDHSRSDSTSRPQTKSTPSETIFGRKEEEESIVKILVDSSHVTNTELSVLPILGHGGLGKTALAQLVFNNEEVTKHFSDKFWVCVSEKFDIKLIIKAIIGATDETNLESLQNMIQKKLKGKTYLLVLDDVWNEIVEQWKELRSILNCGNGAFILTTTRKRIVAEIMRSDKTFGLSPMSDHNCKLLFEKHAFANGEEKTENFTSIGDIISEKCKGVPLLAKTLGSQLRFNGNESEWVRIRDSKMWEISKNQDSILPILALSYYDLPYDSRRCFAFCAIFPKDSKIEKEKLIQLWMAHDLISSEINQELEDKGNIIWDELCWRSLFQEEKLNLRGVQTCSMHDVMHDLIQYIMNDECYIMNDKSSIRDRDFRSKIRHLTIMTNEFKKLPLDSLKNKGGLQSIILHHPQHYNKSFPEENFSVLKELTSLRVLEACFLDIDMHYVGCLKHLRYLNLSGNRTMKVLPDGICDLLNLQTLNLHNCSKLESLPENTKDLIKLRHLHLKGCEELKHMPRGMGQLKDLKTLSLFVIGKEDSDGGQLDEIKELGIKGYLEIRNLERVSDACIKRGISMPKRSSINELELYWDDKDVNRHEKIGEDKDVNRHEKIDEALGVSSKYLKKLKMYGYKGLKIPKRVGESSASLVRLELVKMENVHQIFTITCELFPLLEELCIEDMKNLNELAIHITGVGAFLNLRKIVIKNCPNLMALPPHLKSLKDVTVRGECSNELLDSIISYQSGLTHLYLIHMDARSVLVGDASTSSSNAGALFPSLEYLHIEEMENLTKLVSTTSKAFPKLRDIAIYKCPKLRVLLPRLKSLQKVSIWFKCCDELLHSIISYQSGLTHLSISDMKERTVLFPSANNSEASSSLAADNNEARDGGPSTFKSLRTLEISCSPKLMHLFDKESEGRRLITNLNCLEIWHCPQLIITVEQWRDIITPSLQWLHIQDCRNLMTSVEQWMNFIVDTLHSLKWLYIIHDPNLVPSNVEGADQVIVQLHSLRSRLSSEKCKLDFLEEEKQSKQTKNIMSRCLPACMPGTSTPDPEASSSGNYK